MMGRIKMLLKAMLRGVGLLFCFMMGVLLMIVGMEELLGAPITPENTPTQDLIGTLSARPVRELSGKRVEYIDIHLNEYPECRFQIIGDAMSATKWGQMHNCLYFGDTVYIKVPLDKYHEYKEQLNVQEYRYTFPVYAFRGQSCTFLTLSDYCDETNSSIGAGIVCLLMGTGMVLAILLDIRIRKERKQRRARRGKQNTKHKQSAN